jgi:DNA-binding SARP family transcriptional activator
MTDALTVSLFGPFTARYAGAALTGCQSLKTQELFAFLLLRPSCPHTRERLASLLWGGACTTGQARAYLRKALWQIQRALRRCGSAGDMLQVETDWVQLDLVPDVRVDAVEFERGYHTVVQGGSATLGADDAQRISICAGLYNADLFEGCYADWCESERSRFRHMLLAMLDKLMDHAEAVGAFERGIVHGLRTLALDGARECTHRRLMRLHYLSGDRTAALRQFAQCTTALQDEFGVSPDARTLALHRAIQQGGALPSRTHPVPSEPSAPALAQQIQQIQHRLASVQQQLRHRLPVAEAA